MPNLTKRDETLPSEMSSRQTENLIRYFKLFKFTGQSHFDFNVNFYKNLKCFEKNVNLSKVKPIIIRTSYPL